MIASYLVPERNGAALLRRIAVLSARAEAMGMPALEARDLGVRTRQGHPGRWREIEVSGEPPELNGWSLIGCLWHARGAATTLLLPGQDAPPHQDDGMEARCDCCHTRRHRTMTFLFRNEDTGAEVQVGSSCASQFFGLGLDAGFAESVAAYLRSLKEIEAAHSRTWRYAERNAATEDPVAVAAVSARVLERHGWLSARDAKQTGEPSTARLVRQAVELLQDDPEEAARQGLVPRRKDRDAAKAAIEWITDAVRKRPDSAFLKDLSDVARMTDVPLSDWPLLATLVPVWQRTMDRQAKRRAELEESADSEFVSQRGRRFETLVSVTHQSKPHFSEWGASWMIKGMDGDGNVLTWWTSDRNRYQVDRNYEIRGTVKEHRIWRPRDSEMEIRETSLSRVALIAELPAAAKPAKARRPAPVKQPQVVAGSPEETTCDLSDEDLDALGQAFGPVP